MDVFPYSDHDCVYLEVNSFKSSNSNEVENNILVSRPVDEHKLIDFRTAVLNENWCSFYTVSEGVPADKAFEMFFNILCLKNFDLLIPKRKCTVRLSFKSPGINKKKPAANKHNNVWYTCELANMKSTVMSYLDIYMIHKSEGTKLLYLEIRKKLPVFYSY